jgi:hypothetical protein
MITLQALAVLAMLPPASPASSPIEVTLTCPAKVVQGEPLLVECHLRNVSDQPVWIDLSLPLVTQRGAGATPEATLPAKPTGAIDELRAGPAMTQISARREGTLVALVLQKTQSLAPGPNRIALDFRMGYSFGDRGPRVDPSTGRRAFTGVARQSEIHTVEVEPATPEALLAAAHRLSRKATSDTSPGTYTIMEALLAMPVEAEPAWREALAHRYFIGSEAFFAGFAAKRQDAAGRRTMELLLELAQRRKPMSTAEPLIRKMLAEGKGN